MMTRKEKLEFDVLNYTGQTSMPAEQDEKTSLWIYAIARIYTRRMNESFVVVRNDGNGGLSVMKTFDSDGIGKFISIHPYQFVSPLSMPKYNGIEGLRSLMKNAYGVTDSKVKNLGEDKLKKLYDNYCLRLEMKRLASEAEEKRYMEEEKPKQEEDEE